MLSESIIGEPVTAYSQKRLEALVLTICRFCPRDAKHRWSPKVVVPLGEADRTTVVLQNSERCLSACEHHQRLPDTRISMRDIEDLQMELERRPYVQPDWSGVPVNQLPRPKSIVF